MSGTIAAMERPVFTLAVSKLEAGDMRSVAKLDRLGSNASDIDRKVEELGQMGVRVVALALPVMEVTSAARDLARRVFAAFAQSERDQLVERTPCWPCKGQGRGQSAGAQICGGGAG